MSSVSRKHPFTSLFSPKMSQWCCLSASGLARAGGGRGVAAGDCGDLAGCAREVAGCGRQVPRRAAASRNVLCPITECARALFSAPRDYREFADSGACTTDRFCAIPLSGVADDDGAKTARIPGRGRQKSPPGVETGYPLCLAWPVWPPGVLEPGPDRGTACALHRRGGRAKPGVLEPGPDRGTACALHRRGGRAKPVCRAGRARPAWSHLGSCRHGALGWASMSGSCREQRRRRRPARGPRRGDR